MLSIPFDISCVRVFFFFLSYFAICLCFFGWFPTAVFDVNCLRAFLPRLLLFMLFTLSIALKIFALFQLHMFLCRFHVLYVIDELSGGDNLFS